MASVFEVLSAAINEAIDDARKDKPELPRRTLTLTVSEDVPERKEKYSLGER